MAISLEKTRQKMAENIDAEIKTLMRKGEFFSALGLAYAELKAEGETYATLVRVAQIETHLDLLRRAKRTWQRAAHFNDNAVIHTGLGSVLLREGNFRAAVTAFRRSLERDPNHLPALSSLAIAYVRMDDFLQARRYASRVLLSVPNNVEALLLRARSDLALGHVNSAKGDLATLASLRHSKQTDVQVLRAEVHLHLQEWETALFLAADLCDKNPTSEQCVAIFCKIFRDFRTHGDAARFNEFLSALFVPWVPSAGVLSKTRAYADTSTIDVIIPVHGEDTDAKDCIAEVMANSGPRLGKLILVEYGESEQIDGRPSQLGKTFERVTLVRNTAQAGFMASIMLGLQHSSSSAFAVLAPTTDVTPGWLDILHGALRSDLAAAAVGPLSNAADWQSYGEVFDKSGGQALADTPALRMDLLAAASMGHSAGSVPVPLLRGFCVLFDRTAFEGVCASDLERFTDREDAMIDMSLRLREAGHNLHAVTDCIVFQRAETGPQSKDSSVRKQAARDRLYARYSALCCLTSAMLCRENAEMDAERNRYADVLAAWF